MPLHRNMRRIFATVAAVGLTSGYAGLAQDPGTGRKVGERVDEALQNIKGGLRKAGNAAKGEFARAKAAINDLGIESRVYGRLHWDKALGDDPIELTSTDDGVVTLDGTVSSAEEKAKAVTLARETVGVTRVVDKLAVRPAPTSTTTTP